MAITDFETARVSGAVAPGTLVTGLVGTPGYLDPAVTAGRAALRRLRHVRAGRGGRGDAAGRTA